MAYEKIMKITIPEGSSLDAFADAVRILPPGQGRSAFCLDFFVCQQDNDTAVLVSRISVSHDFLLGLYHKLNQIMSVKPPAGYLLH